MVYIRYEFLVMTMHDHYFFRPVAYIFEIIFP